jgi:hypothetical protein
MTDPFVERFAPWRMPCACPRPDGTLSLMNAWSRDELQRIGTTDELEVAGLRPDGKLNDPVTIWVVRHGDDLYVRSFRGRKGRWYRGAQTKHQGHIRSAGIDKDVSFVDVTDQGTIAAIDDAYRSKYRHYQSQIVDPMLASPARGTTMKLLPS